MLPAAPPHFACIRSDSSGRHFLGLLFCRNEPSFDNGRILLGCWKLECSEFVKGIYDGPFDGLYDVHTPCQQAIQSIWPEMSLSRHTCVLTFIR